MADEKRVEDAENMVEQDQVSTAEGERHHRICRAVVVPSVDGAGRFIGLCSGDGVGSVGETAVVGLLGGVSFDLGHCKYSHCRFVCGMHHYVAVCDTFGIE
jgi:hypothetical protein